MRRVDAGHSESGPGASLGFSGRIGDIVASVIGGGDGKLRSSRGLVGLVVSVVHTVLASDGAFGDGRGREGQDNKGDEGQARCELHGGKFWKEVV